MSRNLLLLTSEKLEIWSDKSLIATWEIPSESFRYMEIVNQQIFEDSLKQFLGQVNFNCRAPLIVGESLIFSKQLDNRQNSSEEFRSLIPLDSRLLAQVVLITSEYSKIFITNISLLETIVKVFEVEAKWQITQAVPLGALVEMNTNSIQSYQEIRSIYDMSSKNRSLNFLSPEAQFDQENLPRRNHNYAPIIVGLLCIFMLIIGSILILIRTDRMNLTNTSVPVPSVTIYQPKPTPTLSKQEVSFLILNGSGVEGEASRLKTIFEEVGYNRIDTSNAKDIINQTKILYSTRSAEFIPNIERLIMEQFGTFSADIKESTSSYDIEITTSKK